MKIKKKVSGGNLAKKLQQAQAKMDKVQNELKSQTFTGKAGGDVVKIMINGDYEILEVSIDKEIVDPDDVEMLQDLITAAFNDALSQVKDKNNEMMSQLMGNFTIPGM
jgi:DNA-binding YbaB/EbfC family protein